MNRKTGKSMVIKTAGLTVALGVLGLTVAAEASAACSFTLPGKSATPPAKAGSNSHMTPAVYRGGGTFVQVGDFFGASIVGVWKVEFVAEGNAGIQDGFLADFGTAVWNEDGTEIMVSGGRQPATGDVCMGAWEQVGYNKFRLSHIALAYAPDSTGKINYLGPASIIEEITLDPSGNTFTGHFTTTQYAAAPTPGEPFSEFKEDPSTIQPPTPIVGIITGKRVTPN
jgi:hypothetical protein